MDVRVIHIRDTQTFVNAGWKVIRVDRMSKYGNPFWMDNESKRAEVCEKFAGYWARNPNLARDLVAEIGDATKVALACWCAPKQCHAETIKRSIQETKHA